MNMREAQLELIKFFVAILVVCQLLVATTLFVSAFTFNTKSFGEQGKTPFFTQIQYLSI